MTLPCLWVSEIPPVLPSDWEKLLGPDELARYHKATAPGRKAQFLAARVLLRKALAATLNAKPESFEISANVDEAPKLLNSSRPIFISLSHTRGACAVLLADSPCGVDIEDGGRMRDFPALAKTAFNPGELARFENKPDRENFYKLWTSKESRYKAGVPCSWEGQLSLKNYRVCVALPLTGLKNLVIC